MISFADQVIYATKVSKEKIDKDLGLLEEKAKNVRATQETVLLWQEVNTWWCGMYAAASSCGWFDVENKLLKKFFGLTKAEIAKHYHTTAITIADNITTYGNFPDSLTSTSIRLSEQSSSQPISCVEQTAEKLEEILEKLDNELHQYEANDKSDDGNRSGDSDEETVEIVLDDKIKIEEKIFPSLPDEVLTDCYAQDDIVKISTLIAALSKCNLSDAQKEMTPLKDFKRNILDKLTKYQEARSNSCLFFVPRFHAKEAELTKEKLEESHHYEIEKHLKITFNLWAILLKDGSEELGPAIAQCLQNAWETLHSHVPPKARFFPKG
jgi:hypothetical protein